MMVPEPENQFDEHAIAIKKLNGDQLGYVPRELNQNAEFQGGVLFGHIKSIGPTMSAPQQLYGAQVFTISSCISLLAESFLLNLYVILTCLKGLLHT